MKTVSALNSKIAKRIISTDFSDFKISTVKIIDNGWDNIVAEVNNRYIFRFLRDPGSSAYRAIGKDFNREIKLLQYLQNKVTLPIPKIEFVGKTCAYSGYKKIPGQALTKKVYDSLSSRQKAQLVFDLANFLMEIHNKPSVARARRMGFVDEDLKSYSGLIKKILLKRLTDPQILDFITSTCQEYDQMIKEKFKPVFLYNDLHTENMAFDPKSKKLNGIFDFSDAMIGDINRDFNPLYKFDPFFMKAVAEKYMALTGRKLNLRRMVIYGRINELCDLAELIDQPESKVYKQIMTRINKWRKEIDIFV